MQIVMLANGNENQKWPLKPMRAYGGVMGGLSDIHHVDVSHSQCLAEMGREILYNQSFKSNRS